MGSVTGDLPFAGQVIRYAYLWKREHDAGYEEGSKDRPCAVVLVVQNVEPAPEVIVVPITHSPPLPGTKAVEIPALVKRRLGLDDGSSWVVTSEANKFFWPGPDLRQIPGLADGVYGVLPPRFFDHIRDKTLQHIREDAEAAVRRTE